MLITNFGVSPCMKCRVNNLSLEVFLAKSFKEDWVTPSLRDAVLHEREAYLRYGDVALTDRHDDDSTVYLICGKQTKNGVNIEERFSVRFVSGQSMSIEEANRFLMTNLAGGSFLEAMQKQLSGDGTFLGQLAFVSRICGSVHSLGGTSVETTTWAAPKMTLTAYAFALAVDHFFEWTQEGARTAYLFGIFREELISRSLTVAHNDHRVPRFENARSMLGGNHEGEITIERTADVYRYPGYFFQVDQLWDLLRQLVLAGKLSPLTLARHIGGDDAVTELMSQAPMNVEYARNLGYLLAHEGMIDNSTISGEELRAMINEHVGDGPQLCALRRKNWDEDFLHLMSQKA